MSTIPIRGRRENIKAELIEIANDPTVNGIVIGIIRGEHGIDQSISTLNMGPAATRANIAFISLSFGMDAMEGAEI